MANIGHYGEKVQNSTASKRQDTVDSDARDIFRIRKKAENNDPASIQVPAQKGLWFRDHDSQYCGSFPKLCNFSGVNF